MYLFPWTWYSQVSPAGQPQASLTFSSLGTGTITNQKVTLTCMGLCDGEQRGPRFLCSVGKGPWPFISPGVVSMQGQELSVQFVPGLCQEEKGDVGCVSLCL
jgi:hypothetical protein